MHFLNHKLPFYADKCDCSTLIVRKADDDCLLVVIVQRWAEGEREGKEWRVEIRHFRTSTGNGRSAYRKPRRHRLFTKALRTVDSGSVGKRKKNWGGEGGRFFKKSGK